MYRRLLHPLRDFERPSKSHGTTGMGRSNQAPGTLPLENEELGREAAGVPSAFAELYRRHVTRVYRYLLARVGNVPDAQDLTSLTFLAAYESVSSYRGEGSYAAWLLGIARRKVADHFRRNRPLLPLEAALRVPHYGPTPEESGDEHSRREQLLDAFRRLSADRAEALSLRMFGGLTALEVGHVMGKSEGAVKMLVSRALRDLRAEFEPQRRSGNE